MTTPENDPQQTPGQQPAEPVTDSFHPVTAQLETALTPVAEAPVPAIPEPLFARYPEDLRAPWTWLDLIIFLFFAVGSIIVLAQLLAVGAVIFLHLNPLDPKVAPNARTAFAVIHQALLSLTWVLYLWAMIRIRFQTPFWRTIGFRSFRVAEFGPPGSYLILLSSGFVFAIVIQGMSVFAQTKTKMPIQDFFTTRPSVLLMMFVGVVIAPLVEETIFRGFLYPVLARGLGVPGGIALTGTLFGLVHAAQLGGSVAHVTLLIVVGMVLTYTRARTGSVTASYLLHLGYNTLLFLGFYLATGGLRNIPQAP